MIKYHIFMPKEKKTFVKKEETATLLQPKKKSRFKLGKKGLLVLIGSIVLLVVIASFLYLQFQGISLLSNDTKQVSVGEEKSLLNNIGKLMVLPSNEQPRIATVTDVAKLLDQPFFAKAQNGDKVLIYQQAGKVILYRPSINKLIDVAPINTNVAQEQAAETPPQALEPITAVVLNGTLTSGLAKEAQAKINTNLSNIKVTKLGDAVNGDYLNTVVIDISGKNQQQAAELAKLLGARVEAVVPEGETSPASDILVILGTDYVK